LFCVRRQWAMSSPARPTLVGQSKSKFNHLRLFGQEMFYILTSLVFIVVTIRWFFVRAKNSSRHVTVNHLNDLPSTIFSFFRWLILKRITPQQEALLSIHEKYELVFVQVKELTYTHEKLKRFLHVCGVSTLGFYYLFPHLLGQRLLSELSINRHFPCSLMGLLHFRSFFEILDFEHIETFVRKVASPELGPFSMEAKYWGMFSNADTGAYLVFTLELFYGQQMKPVWRETLIFYSNKKFSYFHPKAQEISDYYHTLYKFDALPGSKNVCEIEIKGIETWNYAWASGDLNPIHMNSWLANLFGHSARVANGIVVLGKAMSEFAKRDSYIPRRLGVAWMSLTPFEGTVEMRTDRILSETKTNITAEKNCDFDLYIYDWPRPTICVRESKVAVK
jgi:hypothetical protein